MMDASKQQRIVANLASHASDAWLRQSPAGMILQSETQEELRLRALLPSPRGRFAVCVATAGRGV